MVKRNIDYARQTRLSKLLSDPITRDELLRAELLLTRLKPNCPDQWYIPQFALIYQLHPYELSIDFAILMPSEEILSYFSRYLNLINYQGTYRPLCCGSRLSRYGIHTFKDRVRREYFISATNTLHMLDNHPEFTGEIKCWSPHS